MDDDLLETLATDGTGGSGREAPEYYLAALNRQNRENMNTALRPHGLKLADWRILQCLERGSGLSIADLAELAVVERSVASRLIDKLVERGFVQRQVAQADRRFTEISLTAKGTTKLQDSRQSVDHLRAQLFEGLGQDDYDHLLRCLQLLKRNALGFERQRFQTG